MRANLERFQLQKLQPFKEKLSAYHYNVDVSTYNQSIDVNNISVIAQCAFHRLFY